MSPYLQNPLDLGADIVVHSATKYLSGHSDVTAGVAAVKDAGLAEQLAFVQNATGSALGPFEAFLLLRGIKTLAVRLDRQQATALGVARFLSEHPLVERVYFPGLEAHPGFGLHARQARGPGAVISFETGSPEFSRRVVEGLRLFSICVSFGSVNSSVSLPYYMSHASVRPGHAGSTPPARDLVRLSIGLEGQDDLVADLGAAIQSAQRASGVEAQIRNGAVREDGPVGLAESEVTV
jgi:cystathionine beta-lyase